MRRFFPGAALVLAGLLGLAPLAGHGNRAAAQPAAVETIDLTVSPIGRFRIGSDETRFGDLEFIGGFTLSSRSRTFGQLSAMRFLTPGRDFIGVADHGYWFFGAVERDEAGAPVGISDFRMQAMVDADGRVIGDKELVDAEGLDVQDGIATVSFERRARIAEYRIDPEGMGGPIRDLDFIIPRRELRYNAGLETVLRAHPYGIHEGARIVIAERSIDTDGNLFAAILEGPERGIFKVVRRDEFDVTDGVLLPDGDLLLLERRFRPSLGVAMRLRRIYGESVRLGGRADGPVVMEADLSHQIDNMEALDVWQRDDGALIVSIMSDDNQSWLQRTLYLEFRLVE